MLVMGERAGNSGSSDIAKGLTMLYLGDGESLCL